MEKIFRISFANNRLSASLDIVKAIDKDFKITVDELSNFLRNEKVLFGIKEDALKEISANSLSVEFPILVAEGIPPKNGDDAYLVSEIPTSDESPKKEVFNFRNVMKIPSVTSGQPLARIIPPTLGTPGKNVSNQTIPAKNGRPLLIRAGKNVILKESTFFSTIDGQISMTNKSISVNPLFEVNGSLDLRTGNIEFVGNVIIRGDVPTGYEVRAGGDVKIYGLVEGAYIEAGGNVIVSGGIAGANRGKVIAGGNIQASYLNQAWLQAGQDVFAESSILNSKVVASGSIMCKNAVVVGGSLSAGRDIHIKELGNKLFTKTILHAGFDPILNEKEKQLKTEIEEATENLKKIRNIEARLLDNARRVGSLPEEMRAMLQKQQATKQFLESQIPILHGQLQELEEERHDQLTASVYVYETVFPNVFINFGKYARHTQTKYSFVKFYYFEGDVMFEPIS